MYMVKKGAPDDAVKIEYEGYAKDLVEVELNVFSSQKQTNKIYYGNVQKRALLQICIDFEEIFYLLSFFQNWTIKTAVYFLKIDTD